MTMVSSYDAIKALAAGDPVIAGFFNRHWATSYDDFLSALYDDIREGVVEIVKVKHLIVDEGEDSTTTKLQLFLKGMGYACSFTVSGGNVDIEVRRNSFSWIGEAKRYTQVSAVKEGFLQLTTRYAPPINGSGIAYGGLLAYLRLPDAKGKMDDWKEALKKSFPNASDCAFSDCTRFGPLGFYSEHVHESYGTPFRVWHVCVPLHHDPKDKSGKATKARRSTKPPKTSKAKKCP